MARKKSERAPERIAGGYAGIPHAVLDSAAFTGASLRAKALLFEVMRQHNGQNNGHMQLTLSWLKKRGWRSADQATQAAAELIERQLIVQTRQGGLNIGPNWYALSWHSISNFIGLDITSREYHPGRWGLCNLPPASRRKPPSKKRVCSSVEQTRTAPAIGTEPSNTIPASGAKSASLDDPPVPTAGHNERLPVPSLKKSK